MRDDVGVDLREQVYTALHTCLPTQMADTPVELRVLVGHLCERVLATAVREHVALILLGTDMIYRCGTVCPSGAAALLCYERVHAIMEASRDLFSPGGCYPIDRGDIGYA